MRLRNPREFARVFAEGKRSSDGGVTVIAAPNGTRIPRLGLAIPRRHVRRAVGRNRVKRLVRESFRAHQHGLAGLDIVVLARAGIAQRDAAALRAALERHWGSLARRLASPPESPG